MTVIDSVIVRRLARPSKRKCLDFNMKGLRFLGLWPTSGDEKRNFLFYFRYLIPRIQLFRFGYSIIFQIINISLVWGDLASMAEYLIQGAIFTMILVKCGSIFVYREKLKQIFDTFESLHEDEMVPDEQWKRRLIDFDHFVNRASKFVIYFLICTSIINSTSLIVEGLITRTIPLRHWFPYDTRSSPWFEITLISTWTIGILDANMIFTADAVFIVLMLHSVMQFKLLRYKLENTRSIAEKLYAGGNSSYTRRHPRAHEQRLLDEPSWNKMSLHPMGVLVNTQAFSVEGLKSSAESIRAYLDDEILVNIYRLNASGMSRVLPESQTVLNLSGNDSQVSVDGQRFACNSGNFGGDSQKPAGSKRITSSGKKKCRDIIKVENGRKLNGPSESYEMGDQVLEDSPRLNCNLGKDDFVSQELLAEGRILKIPSESYDMEASFSVFSNSLGCTSSKHKTDHGMELYLKHCAQHHQRLLRQTHDIEHVFRITLAQQVITNGMSGIAILYAFILAGEFSTKGLTSIGAFVACITQFLAFCWLGNRLTDESVQVRDAVLGCDWFGASESFKRSMRIMMARSNKPVIMRAGGLPLCMCSFRFMCRGAYYFQMMIGKIISGEKIVKRMDTR